MSIKQKRDASQVALDSMITANNAVGRDEAKRAVATAQAFALNYGTGTVEVASKAAGKVCRKRAQKAYPDYKSKDLNEDKSRYNGLSSRISWCNRILNYYESEAQQIVAAWGNGDDFNSLKLEALYKSTLQSGKGRSDLEKFVALAEKLADGDFTAIFNALTGSEKFHDEAIRLNNFYNSPDFSFELQEVGSEV